MTTRNWLIPQQCGSGEIHIVRSCEKPETWAVVVDGVMRAFRKSREQAERSAEQVFRGLLPESSCPVCGRFMKPNAQGRVPGHLQPKLWNEPGVPCPGAGRVA